MKLRRQGVVAVKVASTLMHPECRTPEERGYAATFYKRGLAAGYCSRCYGQIEWMPAHFVANVMASVLTQTRTSPWRGTQTRPAVRVMSVQDQNITRVDELIKMDEGPEQYDELPCADDHSVATVNSVGTARDDIDDAFDLTIGLDVREVAVTSAPAEHIAMLWQHVDKTRTIGGVLLSGGRQWDGVFDLGKGEAIVTNVIARYSRARLLL
jgi:hypothetical protein